MHLNIPLKSLWAATGAGVVATTFLTSATAAQTAIADLPVIGAPVDGAIGFQPSATELARDIVWLDGMINVIIIAITVLVTALLAFVILRYNARANPKPAGFTHNSPLEIAWTVVPIIILVFIGAFSLPVLFKQQEIPEGDIVIKVTGEQWFWTYEYVDENVIFDSYMVGQPFTLTGEDQDAGAQPYVLNDPMREVLARYGYTDNEWLLATDNAVVVPVGAVVVMQLTASSVIHSWTVPAFGVKQDAVPGRLSQLWFAAEQEGVYFGQCSELCGISHAYMPITVKVVSQEVYDAWLLEAQAAFPAS